LIHVVRRFGDKWALLLSNQVPGVPLLVGKQLFDLLLDWKNNIVSAPLEMGIPGVAGDGRDMEVEAAFGPVLYELTYQESEAVKDVVPIRVEWLRTPLRYDPAAGIRNATTRDQVGIWRNDARNKAIADRVRLLDPGRQVLIVVKTIDHAVHLKRHLPDFELVYANDSPATDPLAGYREQGLVGPAEPVMTTARRRALREDFRTGKVRRAVSTYVWATGVDFPKLDVLIRADAAGSATKDIQIPGRLSRNSAGKTEGLLIDLWDDYSQTYLRKAKGRRGRYGRRGFTQLEPGVLATPGGR
jgi:superfamily II DNA or RNA helicase